MRRIKIKIPNKYTSGTNAVVIPDNSSIGSGSFCIATKSMNEEWSNRYNEKGVICEDIFTATESLYEQETTISIEDDSGNSINELTIRLNKKYHQEKGFSYWTFNVNNNTVYLPERLFQFNEHTTRKRVDMNRAALLTICYFSGVAFKRNKSNEGAFKTFEKKLKDEIEKYEIKR